MPKITIKDKEVDVSEAASIAILAERTDFNREIKALKDSATDKDVELETANNSLTIANKELKTANDALLLGDTLAKIAEVDEDFETDETDPYEIMATVAGVEDGKDDAYKMAYFDSYIAAKIEAENKRFLNKDTKKDKKLSIPDTYYDGGK